MRPSTRIVKIRRQPLRQANLAPDAVLRAVTQVAVERLRRHRRVVAVAAAVCWGQFFYTQVDWGGVGRPGERVRVGLPFSPWLTYQISSTGSGGFLIHIVTWSWLLALAGWILIRVYRGRNPRYAPGLPQRPTRRQLIRSWWARG